LLQHHVVAEDSRQRDFGGGKRCRTQNQAPAVKKEGKYFFHGEEFSGRLQVTG
jgi:hypothetical protein